MHTKFDKDKTDLKQCLLSCGEQRLPLYWMRQTKELVVSFRAMPGQHTSCVVLQDLTCAPRFVEGADVSLMKTRMTSSKVKKTYMYIKEKTILKWIIC